jgi:capsular exopolysaccharide synthesis family protein
MNSTQKKTLTYENYLVELFKTILPYKWSIFAISILAILLAKYYLYFIPSTYESYAIIKVKVNNSVPTQDVLRDSLNQTNTTGIKQEMVTLKTYKTNKRAIQKVDLKTQYFKKEKYKVIELYSNSPIRVHEFKNLKASTVGLYIVLHPKKNGFTLSVKEGKESSVYPFNTEIKTLYFTGQVDKILDFSQDITFKINGNSRYIFEHVIRGRLGVSQIDPSANLIKVSFQDTIPERANQYIDALIEAYIELSIEKKEQTNKKVLTFLDKQLEATRKKLEASENELASYKSKNRVEPSVKSHDSFEKLSRIELDLSEVEMKGKLVSNLILFIKNNQNLDSIGPTLMEFNDQSTLKLIDTLQTYQQQESALKFEFTDKYPKLINLRQQMQNIRKKILLNMQNLKSTLVTKRIGLERQEKKYEKTLKELPIKEKHLVHFQRDYEVNSKMYSYLLEKKSENELIEVASVSDYEAIDKAYNSLVPIKPKRSVVVIIAAILGLFFGLIIAFLRSMLVDKIKTQTDVQLLTELPIYGVIPLYKNAMFSSLLLKESYHKLATNLQFSKRENQGSIILVTSNIEGEGKTTTVANLAGVFQNSQYKSILIDLNMRNPSLHKYFGIEHQYSGMSTYLSERDNIGNIIFSTNYPNLDIITAGPVPPNPSELILSARLQILFQTLKQKYDYIIIDTSSYDIALETLYVMQYTTMNLVVLRENFSKKSAVRHLESLIQEKNLKNIALVLKSTIKEKKVKTNDFLPGSESTRTIETKTAEPIQLSL